MDQSKPRKKYPQFRRWSFTWNNYGEDNVNHLYSLTKEQINCIYLGFEICPTTGTPHIQGYAEFPKLMSLKQVKELFDPVLGLKSAVSARDSYKNREANVHYCTKSETKDPAWIERTQGLGYLMVEHKVPTRGEGTTGNKDMVARREQMFINAHIAQDIDAEHGTNVLDTLRNEDNMLNFMARFPMEAIKHFGNLKEIKNLTEQEEVENTLKKRFPQNLRLMMWMRHLHMEIQHPAPDRKVLWYWSGVGGLGKSSFIKWMSLWEDVQWFNNAGSGDIALAWDGKSKVVFFDIEKSVEGMCNYTVMEKLSNAMLFSKKYHSCSKRGLTPWVIVFSNFPPDLSTMMPDRWVVRELTTAHCDPEPNPHGLLVDYVEIGMPEVELDPSWGFPGYDTKPRVSIDRIREPDYFSNDGVVQHDCLFPFPGVRRVCNQ